MKNIFFSWQNNLDKKTHRNYIEKCIKKTIKSLNKEDSLSIYCNYDRDTLGIMGTPDITFSIFNKIDNCSLFIADISNVGTSTAFTPNPNVLIELGYAIHSVGWNKVICLFDINTGSIEQLPFDIRQRRIIAYNPNLENEDKKLSSIIRDNITSLYSQGQLFNPLIDYMKGKIDYCILYVGTKLSNLLFKTVASSDGLKDVPKLLDLDIKQIKEKLISIEFFGFVLLDSYEIIKQKLKDLLKDLFASNYFDKSWVITVLEIIDWLDFYSYLISPRNSNKLLIETGLSSNDKYFIINSKSRLNNPNNIKLVLEKIYKNNKATDKGVVINYFQYPNTSQELNIYRFNPQKVEYLENKFVKFIEICNNWLEITDSEFILDPEMYKIGSI